MVTHLTRLRPSSLPLLISVSHYLSVLSHDDTSPAHLVDAERLKDILSVLIPNISSPNSAVRETAVHLDEDLSNKLNGHGKKPLIRAFP